MGILAGAGCGRAADAPVDPNATVIARVGDRSVTIGEFSAYLAENLGGPADAEEAEPAVKSRLLDQFLDEELLVAAAVRKGLEVSDEEMKRVGGGSPGDRERYRRALLQRKYKREVILEGVSVTDEEVRAYFGRNIREFRRPAGVVIRKVLLDTAHEARSVRAELAAHGDQFEEIAATRSLSPDGGRPQALEEEALPEKIREAVEKLQPGELSPVVEDAMGFYILRLEERQPASAAPLEQVHDQIELKLLQAKSQQRYRESVEALRAGTRVEIMMDKLGFEYARRDAS